MKKHIPIIVLLATLTLSVSEKSLAGEKAGNGGFAYVSATSVELVDLKEVQQIPFLNSRLRIVESGDDYETELNRRIQILNTVRPHLGNNTLVRVRAIEKQLEIRRTIDNTVPDDLGFVPSIPGYQIRNVIQYGDTILVDSDLFARLSGFQKAALFIHEALYLEARGRNWTHYRDLLTSIPVRRMVAILFSENVEEFKEILGRLADNYLTVYGRERPRQAILRLCFDRRFLMERNDTVDLDSRYFKKMKFSISQYRGRDGMGLFEKMSMEAEESVTESIVATTLLERNYHKTLRGEDFRRENHRCDGSPGESFVAESEILSADYTNRIELLYKAKGSDLNSEKLLNASLTISLVDPVTRSISDEQIVRSIVGRRNKEGMIDVYATQYLAQIILSTTSNPVPKQILEWVNAR